MNLRTTVLEDIYRFEWLSRPTLSPGGKQMVYEKSVAREKENDFETQMYLADFYGYYEEVLRTSGTRNLSPVWAWVRND